MLRLICSFQFGYRLSQLSIRCPEVRCSLEDKILLFLCSPRKIKHNITHTQNALFTNNLFRKPILPAHSHRCLQWRESLQVWTHIAHLSLPRILTKTHRMLELDQDSLHPHPVHSISLGGSSSIVWGEYLMCFPLAYASQLRFSSKDPFYSLQCLLCWTERLSSKESNNHLRFSSSRTLLELTLAAMTVRWVS